VTVKGIDSADGKFLTQSIKKVVAAIQPAQSK
jgi:hypothetical protein